MASQSSNEVKPRHLEKIHQIKDSLVSHTLSYVPPILRRSVLGRIIFFAVAIGAGIFCAHQLIGLAVKFFNFEPTKTVSVDSDDPAVNITIHVQYPAHTQKTFTQEFTSYLQEKVGPLTYNGANVTDIRYDVIQRHAVYYIFDEYCVPSPNPNMTAGYINNTEFDASSSDFQNYLSGPVEKELKSEKSIGQSFRFGKYDLDNLPWVHYYEEFVSKKVKAYVENRSPNQRKCRVENLTHSTKKEEGFTLRYTWTLPSISCLPLKFTAFPGDNTVYISGGTQSTKETAGLATRLTLADSARVVKKGKGYNFVATFEHTKRDNRYCNKDLDAESNCVTVCRRERLAQEELKKNRPLYYDAFQPKAMWRQRSDNSGGDIYKINVCSPHYQKKLADTPFSRKVADTEAYCNKRCYECGRCRVDCDEMKVTLNFPSVPIDQIGEHINSLTVLLSRSYSEVLLTEFQVGYSFWEFVSDIGGMFKLTTTIIGCVVVVALVYYCVVLRYKGRKAENGEDVEYVGKNLLETIDSLVG